MHRIGKHDDLSSAHCAAPIEDAKHTLKDSQAYNEDRTALAGALGPITPESIWLAMTSSNEPWTTVRKFAFDVMSNKEQAERDWAAAGGYGTDTAKQTLALYYIVVKLG